MMNIDEEFYIEIQMWFTLLRLGLADLYEAN